MNDDYFELCRQVAEQAGLDWAASQSNTLGKDAQIVLTIAELHALLCSEWGAGSNNCPGWAQSTVSSLASARFIQEARKAFLAAKEG